MKTGITAASRSANGPAITARPVRSRLRSLAAATFLIGLSQVGLAGAAWAQGFFDDDILPPRAVALRLAESGFSGISRPRFDGRAYVVEAFAPGGARLRLVVDPEDGEILTRQRLDGPVPIVRPAPVAPGYGWTEEDVGRGRPRMAERLTPPADIPWPEERGARAPRGAPAAQWPEPARREGAPAAANPYGLNPEAGRAAPASRRVARVAPAPELRSGEDKPALRTSPEAPRPAASRKAPAEAKIDAPKVPDAKPAESAPAEAKSPDVRAAEAKPSAAERAPQWKDPPEGRRNVRVIGGATVVPGTADKEGGAAQ